MTVELSAMPEVAQRACTRLRDELIALLGDDLVALWAYGAAVFPDPPAKLGDIDTHAVLARSLDAETGDAIDAIHKAIEHDIAETDSWYVLLEDARKPEPHRHAFKPHVVDHAWALHRAHWLAGKYVLLAGERPESIVRPPTWEEIARALDHEFSYIEEFFGHAWASPYCIWNCCRIIYSFETRDVVVSKRAAARWALANLPDLWHDAIRAAERCYDGVEHEGDRALIRETVPSFLAYAMERTGR